MAQIKISTIKHPILFVDDDELILKQMIRLFHRNAKVELLTADSVMKARDIMESKEIHMLITDQRMPIYNGTTLLAYARRRQPNALRILLTGYADATVLAESINDGNLFRYYAKPVVPDKFVNELNELLRIYEMKMKQYNRRFLLNSRMKIPKKENDQPEITFNKEVFHFNDTRYSLRALKAIVQTLSEEKDVERIYLLILNICRNITNVSAGAIYFIDNDTSGQRLRMKEAFSCSKKILHTEKSIPIDASSIIGFVALNQKSVILTDANTIPDNEPYAFNKLYDSISNIRIKSLVAVPIMSMNGSTIGVIQLINRKIDSYGSGDKKTVLETGEGFTESTIPFSQDQVEFLEAVACLAANSIENIETVRQLNSQFEGFAIASIKAIEARNPSNNGHALRVANLCVTIARRIGILEAKDIKSLEYAALLHDIGNIYFEPSILPNCRKLNHSDFTRIQQTLDYMYRYQELSYSRHELRLLDLAARTKSEQSLVIRELHHERDRVLKRIRYIKYSIELLNEPGRDNPSDNDVLDQLVKELNKMKCLDINDIQLHPLNADDISNLSIKSGTGTDTELLNIEKRISYTNRIISEIPWTQHFSSVPKIFKYQQKKMVGRGSQEETGEEKILISAQILVVADMFDSLTAKSNGCRDPNSVSNALEIVEKEVVTGHIGTTITDVLRSILENHTSTTYIESLNMERES